MKTKTIRTPSLKESKSLKASLNSANSLNKHLYVDIINSHLSDIKYVLQSKNVFKKRVKSLLPLLISTTQTAYAITQLDERVNYTEMVMVSRSYLEKVINFFYLLVCDEEEYQNYLDYSLQKSFRKLDREIVVGSSALHIQWGGLKQFTPSTNLQEALTKFTSESGREKTRWTNKSIEDRLEIIDKKSLVKIGFLQLLTLSVYEDASEALHGTLYGSAFQTGYHLPEFTKNKNQVEERLLKNTLILYVLVDTILVQLLLVLTKNKNQFATLVKRAEKNLDNLEEVFKLGFN